MSRRTLGVLLASVVVSAVSACSSSDDPEDSDDGDPTGPGGTNSEFFMRTNIDGAWAAESLFGVVVAPGTFTISGGKTSGANPYLISITMYNMPSPLTAAATFPLGTGPSVAGGSVTVGNAATGAQAWFTPLSGADGTITITTLNDERVAGTFSFTVSPLTNATGDKTATGGEFVIPFTRVAQTPNLGPLPESAGSKASLTVNGANWNAANATASYFSANRVAQLSAANNQYAFSISLAEVTGTGTYPLGENVRVITATAVSPTGTAGTWTSSAAGGSGSVSITSLTASRIKGTFTATLQPLQGTGTTGTLAITNGTFDMGLLGAPE